MLDRALGWSMEARMADLFWLSDEQWAVVGRFMPIN